MTQSPALPCPPAQWPRFSALLDQALEQPEAARTTWLLALAGDDAPLRPALARVLAAGDARTPLDTAPLPPPAGSGTAPPAPGAVIGPYVLIERLGEGGMGEVWRARPAGDGPARDIALKLPHADSLSGRFLERFRRERDVLAALSHKAIAQLYEAGQSADGQPYLALELIEGAPITQWCHSRRSPIAARIDLAIEMLDALDYAHRRLIVHRDIKPANVLITAEGQLKLLDFGIAKLLGVPTDSTLTQPLARMATPAYAAPEQLAGGAVTVASDVFSAGALLFELLTGQRPFARVPSDPAAEPAPLASKSAQAQSAGAPEGRRLGPLLRGDIDAVLARALALDPAERYPSAAAFAADLRRLQRGQPITARRIGPLTRLVKFVRRNPAFSILAAAFILAINGGTAAINWQALRAQREAARATAIKDFMVGLFAAADAHGQSTGRAGMTAKELLDEGAGRAAAAFAGDPATEIEVLDTLATIYLDFEDADRNAAMRLRRLELARGLWGEADRRVINGTIELAEDLVYFMRRQQARAILADLRPVVLRHFGAQSREYARWLSAHASSLRGLPGGWREAIEDTRQAVAILTRLDDPAHHDALADALSNLGGTLIDGEYYEESLAVEDRWRDLHIAHGQFDAMAKIIDLTQRCSLLIRLGRADALATCTEAQTMATARLGADSSWALSNLTYRALILHETGQRHAALDLFARGLALGQGSAAKSVSSGQRAAIERAYGQVLLREGRAAEALPLLEAALAKARLQAKDAVNLPRALMLAGEGHDALGHAAQARALMQEARREWARIAIPQGIQSLAAEARWGHFLLTQNDPQASAVLSGVLATQSRPCIAKALAAADLARIALAQGDLPAAQRLSEDSLRRLDAVTIEYDIRARLPIWLTRASVLHAMGDSSAAAALARRARDSALAWDAPGAPAIAQAEATLAAITSPAGLRQAGQAASASLIPPF